MTRINDMRGDLQAESSGWLFKSPLAGGGGILWRPPIQAALLVQIVACVRITHVYDQFVGV